MATLERWENSLELQLADVDLIGELDLTPEQTQELGVLIRRLFRSHGFQHATQVLQLSYPRSLAAFLVFQGIYGYNEGDYWSAACDAAGIPTSPNYTAAWGQAFEQIVGKLGLSRPFAGHRYVGAILGHGGIPLGSLPDFFAQMLQPSVTKPEWAGLGTSELIEEWLASSAHYFVNKPVLRFLEYGGHVAEDFVERCRQMVSEYVADGAVPLAGEVGLRQAVIDSYQAWVESAGQTRTDQISGPRLRRPQMRLDPWSLGVYLHLPEQQISALEGQGRLRWEIQSGDHIRPVPVRVRRVDMYLKTEAVNFPLETPAPTYTAKLFAADDRLLEEWRLDGPSDRCPLMVFDPDRQAPITIGGSRLLRGQVLWVIAAPDVTLGTNPHSDQLVREQLPRLPWGWHDWHAIAMDLASACEFIWQDGTQRQALGVRAAEGLSMLGLVGGSQVEPLAEQTPLFVGEPPRLRIPWPGADKSDSALRRWRLELRNEWEAEPSRRVAFTLDELQAEMQWKDGAVEMILSAQRLLGPAPVGQFRIKVRGPLGMAQELRLRMAPRLGLTGHEQVALPDPQRGASPVELIVETDAGSELQLLQYEPSYGFELAVEDEEARYYCIEVPPDRTEAPLRLVHALELGRNVYLPIRVPIRRLRWMLVLDPADLARSNWLSHAPDPISLGQLEQSDFPYLIVELPAVDEPQIFVQLRFLTAAEDVIWEGSAQVSPGTSRFCRFDLRMALDSIRQSRSALSRARLVVQALPGHEEVRLLALSIRQGICVREVTAVPREAEDGLHLHLRWQPEIPLRGRYVRFWPQTCPWRDPVGIALPDDARQEHVAHLVAGVLSAGNYLAEFTVRDPWLPETKPERPLVSAENVTEVQVGDLEQRLAELVDGRDEASLSFDEHCERILLRQTLGDRPGVEHDLQSCYEHVHLASVQQLVTLIDGLEDGNPTVKAMRLNLYHAGRIEKILSDYHRSELSEENLRAYLARIHPAALKSIPSCRVLLQAPDDQLRLQAAAFLMGKCEPEAVRAIIAWAEEGMVSEADTLRLLDSNLAFTTRVLNEMPATPLVTRLWERLAEMRPEQVRLKFIRPRQWVRCQAGWGRIERIEGPDGARLDVVAIADLARGCHLHVVLRPGEDSESVVIDVGRRKVIFSDDAIRYHCSTCHCCAVREEHRLYSEHRKAAHPLHKGETFGYSPFESRSLRQSNALEFSLHRPAQLWA